MNKKPEGAGPPPVRKPKRINAHEIESTYFFFFFVAFFFAFFTAMLSPPFSTCMC